VEPTIVPTSFEHPALEYPALEYLARFSTPPAEYGPLPIWWWSGGRLTRERLRWQMTQLVSRGVRQAVVMCLAPTGPLFGCLADDPPFQSPEWWELLEGACAGAAELGFRLWLYDQIGFSGANLQGRLVAASPGFAGMVLRRTVAQTSGAPAVLAGPAGDTALAGYAVTGAGTRIELPVERGQLAWAGGPAKVVLVHAGASGFDYLSAGDVYRGEAVVVDGLLGTGASGAPRGAIAAAVALLPNSLIPNGFEKGRQSFPRRRVLTPPARTRGVWPPCDRLAAGGPC